MNLLRRLSLVLVILAATSPLLVMPETSYAGFGPFDHISDICANEVSDMCTVCDLTQLGKNIIDFFVFFAVIVAALLFVHAGVLYIFSPANPASIARAHKIFISTLIGLLIILASWLLIDFIMKSLYNESEGEGAWGPWNDILCSGGDEQANIPPGSTTAFPPVATMPPNDWCPTCEAIASNIPHKSLAENGCAESALGECQIAPGINTQLSYLSDDLSTAGTNWQVTESWPPTVVHLNPCHQQGTCVDANFTSGTEATPANIVSFIDTAQDSELRAVYEVQTDAERQAILDSAAFQASGLPDTNVITVSGINANHFSVYGAPTTPSTPSTPTTDTTPSTPSTPTTDTTPSTPSTPTTDTTPSTPSTPTTDTTPTSDGGINPPPFNFTPPAL